MESVLKSSGPPSLRSWIIALVDSPKSFEISLLFLVA